ncbi:MAG: hypothetical protein Q7S44_01655 [bacterium]|nr:hypothetical protein [bacterium]
MEKKLTTFAIIYFIIGLVFAISFALFYHWPGRSFFSPGFYVVVLTWPIQIPGYLSDFQIYGLAGKTLI